MFKKIIVPLDLTDRHASVLTAASELAAQSGGEVILLHVIESIGGGEDAEVEKFYRHIEESAQKHLDSCGQELDAKNISWHSRIAMGARAQEIARFAEEAKGDLIVVYAPQIDPQNPAQGWASLSWKISLLASIPVLLVK